MERTQPLDPDFPYLMPEVDEGIPLPATQAEALPPLTPREELDMRARTVKMIADLQGIIIEPEIEHRAEAAALAEKFIENKRPPHLAQYPNETIAYLAGMVAEYDSMIVREYADLKKYVVNKLIQETDHPDAKIRVTALKALGEVDGVDAFKKRTEVTVKQQSLEEVELELKETLSKLKNRAVMAEPQDITDIQAKVIEKSGDEDDIDPENPDAA